MSKKVLSLILSALMLLAYSLTAFANSSDMRATLFSDIDVQLQEANAVKASILAPVSYGAAAKLYKSAETLLKNGKNIDKIRRNIEKANIQFTKSIKASKFAQLTFEDAMQARTDSEAAQANIHTVEQWKKAERTFALAAKALESGKVNKGRKLSAQAQTEYRSAELAAIKTSYLDGTRKLIETAKKIKVYKYAPKTLLLAQELLTRAESGLNKNRYDTDEPRLLAKQALYEAKHAIYISQVVNQLNDDEISAEDLILQSEKPVVDIASGLDLVVHFDQGLEEPTQHIRQEVSNLRADAQELANTQSHIITLEAEIAMLGKKLGVQSSRLAAQEKHKQRLKQLESLFTAQEAIILSKGGDVLVRTIGLNFKSGSDQIESRNFNLLKKAQQALRLFPGASVVVEGHTDSFGSDDINLDLSKNRADAVKSYLVANMPDGETMQIAAVGYGESKPIGNNETEEGRTKNRRIDLIVIPTK